MLSCAIPNPGFTVLKRRRSTAWCVCALVACTACASASTTKENGVVPAASAVDTRLPEADKSSTARSAISRAAVGGEIGAIIGREMDQQAKELKEKIPSAVVQRVGEGLQVTFSAGQLFEFDSDRLLGESAKNFSTLAKSLVKHPGTNLLIVGHADSLGTTAINQDLSLRRARATAAYLTSQGVAFERIKSEGKGELEPIADNSTEAGQARNRRVEVAIFANELGRAKAAAKAAKGP